MCALQNTGFWFDEVPSWYKDRAPLRAQAFSLYSQSYKHTSIFFVHIRIKVDGVWIKSFTLLLLYPFPRKTNWRGRLSTVDLLAPTYLVQLLGIYKKISVFQTKRVNLERRSIVLSFPVQLVFPALSFPIWERKKGYYWVRFKQGKHFFYPKISSLGFFI